MRHSDDNLRVVSNSLCQDLEMRDDLNGLFTYLISVRHTLSAALVLSVAQNANRGASREDVV